MIIGLMGFEFCSANKGCEALGYSFISLLEEMLGDDITIYYFSNDSLGELPTFYPRITFKAVPLKIKDKNLETIRGLKECDYVYDVTLGDSFSDIYSKQQCLGNMKFKFLAEVFAKKYILLPQTYGPFRDKIVKKCAKYILKHANGVWSRDEKSALYVKKICTNIEVRQTTDLAFVLPFNSEKYTFDGNCINIGLNVSGLLWKGGFHEDNQFDLKFKYKDYIFGLIEGLLDRPNVKIHLIPHVIDLQENAYDDDYKVLLEINKKYHNTLVAPAFTSPIEAKSYISKMNFFIGSRMHSTIAAFSAGVPVVPVSYSRKFEGLFESLDYPYVIHATEDELEYSLRKTFEYFDSIDMIQTRLLNNRSVLEKEVANLKILLKESLNK